LYEVEPVEVDQASDTAALPAAAVNSVGAEGMLLAPEELELLLDELDEDELLDDEEEEELEEEEPVPLELPPPDELEEEELLDEEDDEDELELEDDELEELLLDELLEPGGCQR
jgi:hypothetical protein